jgi:16S rRNA (adenine1518-N6/adenine1519-N6)-dimethyltransferase
MSPLKLDQHFLIDENTLAKIVETAQIKPDDIILEIGAGKGALTLELAKNSGKVIAIELDEEFRTFLDKMPANVEVRYGNALELIDQITFNKIVANIPYNITEPLFGKLLKTRVETVVLLIGKNFYNILMGKDSKWSVIIPVFFDVTKVANVPNWFFEPMPRTDSVVVALKKRQSELSTPEQIIKEFVLQDDKKVFNALAEAFVRVEKLSQKQAKAKVSELNLSDALLDKKVAYLSNKQFMAISTKLS